MKKITPTLIAVILGLVIGSVIGYYIKDSDTDEALQAIDKQIAEKRTSLDKATAKLNEVAQAVPVVTTTATTSVTATATTNNTNKK